MVRFQLVLSAVLASSPALAVPLGIQQDLPTAEAIARLSEEKSKIYEEHLRRIQASLASNPKLHEDWRRKNGAFRIRRFVDRVHEGVLDRIRASGASTLSAREVESYARAFGREIGIVRRAYVKEFREDGRVQGRDWDEILAATEPQRKKEVVDAFAERGRGASVIRMLDGQISETLAARKAGSQPSAGGGGPAGPALDAEHRIAFGDVAGAQERLDRAIREGGADSGVYAMRAAWALDEGRFAAAAGDARRALALDPLNKEAMVVLRFSENRFEDGAGAGSSPDFEERRSLTESAAAAPSASRVALRSAADAPRHAAAVAARQAESALRLGDVAGALAHADRGLEHFPDDPALLALRASVRLQEGRYDQAAADAERGLERDPKSQALLRAKAYAENRLKRWREAVASSNRLLELHPEDPYGHAYRAHAHAGLGDKDAMLADIGRAARLDPRFGDAARQAAGLQLPSEADVFFLFPGEAVASAASPAPLKRARSFGLVLLSSVLGGLLLALGLVRLFLARGREASAARAGSARGANLVQGQYEISRQIGAGGMGMVFEGTDRSLGRRVAIKKMREEIRRDARERARFVAEAKTVAALHHPGIVEIYAIAEEGEDVFLVFEYVDGRTVHELAQVPGGLRPGEAVRVVREAASALDYAHSRGVIHRDMKPSNVMVDGQGRVKVMDFGIARAAKDAMTRHSVTKTIAGTPPYMAPEQEQGIVRRESDVYSLAVCAYEMLTGKLPFAGVGGGMSLNKLNMSYVPPSRQKEGLPAGLDAVFSRAFQADPDGRYRSPGEFSAALSAALPT